MNFKPLMLNCRVEGISIKDKATNAVVSISEKEQADKAYKKNTRSLSNCSMQELDVYSFIQSSQNKSYPDFRIPHSRKLSLNTHANYIERINVVCTMYNTPNYSSTKTTSSDEVQKCSVDRQNAETKPVERSENGTSKMSTELNNAPSTRESLLQNLKDIVLLYRNPVYILISLCVATYFWVFIPVLTVVVDYSRDKGIPNSDTKYLIHALTIGDLIGRLCFGWVTDKKVLTFPIFMTLTHVFQGVFVSLFPFATGFWLYMAILILYGVTAGIIFVHFPVLVYKYMDEKKQALAVGCVGLLSGVVTFGIPPLIGLFRDQIGSYDGLFYIIGLVSVITGCLWLLEPLFLRIADRLNAGKS